MERRWSGDWLTGIVAAEQEKSLAVLWLGYGEVVMAGTAGALTSAHANALRQNLVQQHALQIVDEYEVSEQVLASMRQNAVSGRKRAAGPLSVDEVPLRVYDEIFEAARVGRASDIHISAIKGPSPGTVSLRLYGRMRQWRQINSQLLRSAMQAAFGKRLVSSTNTKPTLSFTVDNAFITENVGENNSMWNGRCNGRPDLHGYKLVTRLLECNPDASRIPTLEDLGYLPSHVRMLRDAVKRNWGVVIIFGSTGSGKSTTLRTFIVRETDPSQLAVYSVESPVEYEMPGVTQFSIPVESSASSEETMQRFVSALRDVVRMDPDVLMVGEVRDSESGRLMSEFANSGHRCYTTAHGDGAVEGLMRLCGEQIRMPSELLAGRKFLSASIYQRLLPKLCLNCRVPATDPDHGLATEKIDLLKKKFGISAEKMYVANPQGCPNCRPDVPDMPSNGTKGVTVAAEVMVPDAEIRDAAARREWSGVTRLWRMRRRSGFHEEDMHGKTAYECALYLAAEGIVSLADVEAEFEPIEAYEVYPRGGEDASR